MPVEAEIAHRQTVRGQAFQCETTRPQVGGDRQCQRLKCDPSVVRVADGLVYGDEMAVEVEGSVKGIAGAERSRDRGG